MQLLESIWHSAIFGAACSLLTYSATYFTIGKRANRFPAGAVIPSIFLTPWWPALCAGLAAHGVGILVTNAYRREKSPKGVTTMILLAGLAFCGTTSATMISLTSDVMNEIEQSNNAAWGRIAASGAAGNFVKTHYRPCVVPTYSFNPRSPMTIAGYERQLDARRQSKETLCAASTITLAREHGRDEFAHEVSLVLRNLPTSLQLSQDASAKLESLTR